MGLWLPPEPVVVPAELTAAAGSRALAEVLFRRGCTTPQAVEAFLTGGVDLDAPGLPDLEEGAALLAQAVAQGRRICVYGDYDTDGITATTLLVSLLRSLGAAVTYYVPNRFRDGYGVSSRAVEALAEEGVEVLLTCDCGIRNLDEVALARRLGMQVVVTDHHELGPELPTAEAVINPKRLPEEHPCRMLPGVGTAYLLARRLLRFLDRPPEEADRWLDLVAVGIIADVVPLTGANRVLARRGLEQLVSQPCPGLAALMAAAGVEGTVTEEEVAFQLVPRLNAAGRLADASLGVRLLLAEGRREAAGLAQELDHLNTERKRLTAAVVAAAEAAVTPEAPGIVLYRPEWHEGVLGIAAGRLVEEHGMPALLITKKQVGGLLVGSARAPAGFGLHEALAACEEHLVKYGGHDAAAGFSLLPERFDAFRAAMLEEIRRRTRKGAAPAPRRADLEIALVQVDRQLYDDLRRGAPYGEGNPPPVLCSRRAKLLSARPVGPHEEHLRLVLRDGENSLVGIWFRAGAAAPTPGEVDLVYQLGLNRWHGEELLQVVVAELGPAGSLPEAPPVRSAAAEAPRDEHAVAEAPAAYLEAAPAALGTAAGSAVPEAAEEVEPGTAALPDVEPAGPEEDELAAAQPEAALPNELQLVDRRGESFDALAAEYPDALYFAEMRRPEGMATVDRFGLRSAATLVLLTPPASPALLDEAVAATGARRVVLGWSREAEPSEERFLPNLMQAVAGALRNGPWVSVSQLAVQMGELESAVRMGLWALAESALLTIEDEERDLMRLRLRTDGRGIKKGPALHRMRNLLRESRAFRRFLRTAAPEAIRRSIYTR